MNFTIIKTNDVLFSGKKRLATVYVKCNNCQNEFHMGYVGTANIDGSWNKKYEYKYCPHCAKELKEYEENN